jgi:hypothetical protein
VGKCMEFHIYELRDERGYRVVLKNMHYSMIPEDINIKIEKLGHTVTNIWIVNQ